MSVITKNIDSRPYTGERNTNGKVRVKTSGEAKWLDGYFDGNPQYSQVKNITRGKIYDVVKVIGYGDMEGIVIINDIGEEKELCDFFFEEVI